MMNPSEFLDVLDRLVTRLQAGATREISGLGERRYLRSVIGAWFSEYRPAFIEIVGEEQAIRSMDDQMQELLKLASDGSSRRTVVRLCRAAIKNFKGNILVPLSRAYWSLAPERSLAGYDEEVSVKLKGLDPSLAESYEQSVLDIEDEQRLSYRGTAAELREVVTDVLHVLAPTAEVQATEWYKEARRSGARKESTPTRAERTRFILRARAQGSAVTDAAESYMNSVEERLADVVNVTYRRGSAAAHVGAERAELVRLLPYINALLRELLLVGADQERKFVPLSNLKGIPANKNAINS
jgi:Predicted pPIWI-associating nuclease